MNRKRGRRHGKRSGVWLDDSRLFFTLRYGAGLGAFLSEKVGMFYTKNMPTFLLKVHKIQDDFFTNA